MNGPAEIQGIVRDIGQIRFFRIATIFAVATASIMLIQRYLPWLAAKLPTRIRAFLMPLPPVLRLLILVVAAETIIPLIIEPTPENLMAILGATGLAVGFAFKDYIGSLIAGIVSLFERPYRIGDWVSVDGDYGEVRSLGLRSLKIVTPDDTAVTIPHGKIWGSNIHNANDGSPELMCVTDFYLDPRHDPVAVRETLLDVGLACPYTHLERPITVVVRETPWGTHYRLKAYPFDGKDQFRFTSELTVRGKTALARLGVEPATAPPVSVGGGDGQ